MSLLFRNAISIALFSVSATGPPCCPAVSEGCPAACKLDADNTAAVWARNVPPKINAPIPSAHAALLPAAIIFSILDSFATKLPLVGAGLAPPGSAMRIANYRQRKTQTRFTHTATTQLAAISPPDSPANTQRTIPSNTTPRTPAPRSTATPARASSQEDTIAPPPAAAAQSKSPTP